MGPPPAVIDPDTVTDHLITGTIAYQLDFSLLPTHLH